ncbi:MAG: hypothetical protein ABIP23_08430 [Pelobium sp.]
MLILIILASLIPGVLAVLQYIESNKKEKDSKRYEMELKGKIENLTIANAGLSNQITGLSSDNLKLSRQLTETSLLLNENLRGGDKVDISAIQANSTQIKISAMNNSVFPVYDVQVVILDYDEIIKCKNTIRADSVFIDIKCYKANISIVPTFNMSPNNETEIPNLLPIKGELMHYAFQIKTRNGITLRHSVFKVKKNKIEQSYRIYEFNNGKLVLTDENNPLKLTKEYWDQHFYSQPYVYTTVYEN